MIGRESISLPDGEGNGAAMESKADRLADLTLEEAERRLITQALTASRGNVSEAARRLGISLEAMRYRPQKHGIVPDGLKWAAPGFRSPCPSPSRQKGIEGVNDLWAEEGTKGTNREHGLHADVPEKAGATHVPRDAWCGSPLLIPSALRARDEKHYAYLYHYVQICIAIRSEFPVRKRPSKDRREPSVEALVKTLQRQETHA